MVNKKKQFVCSSCGKVIKFTYFWYQDDEREVKCTRCFNREYKREKFKMGEWDWAILIAIAFFTICYFIRI